MYPPNGNLSTTNLPILQKILDTYKAWYIALPHTPRLTRHTLGEKISQYFIDLIELIFTAAFASRDQKSTLIQKASIKLDTLKFFLQIALDLKAIDSKQFASISSPLVEAGKMLGGWYKQQLSKNTLPN